MSPDALCLYSLPNEILVSILSGFETQTLLPLAVVSRRFHSIILRIIHFRLLLAVVSDYKVFLEAYHPSTRHSDPSLFCSYLGTDGLSAKHEGEGSLYEDCASEKGRFAKLGALYSRFSPDRLGMQGLGGSLLGWRVATGAPDQATPNPTQPSYAEGDDGSMKVLHNLNLDADELFVQFCAYATLIKVGERRASFFSEPKLVQSGQGVMRVWKQWLQDRACALWEQEQGQDQTPEVRLDRPSTTSCPSIGSDKNILWTDYRKNVGLRVAVRDREGLCYGKAAFELDDVPMSFSLEIQELVVRTTHLMLVVETATKDTRKRSGKALVFGRFASVSSSPEI
ncbi:hypothetical protein A1O3_06941 [Capronia epimyces CBS 606.96]|uniref:F-box domain-containing protein n=1 Tax=Capronia epimyces CBS 606.96 TaxID=1182542 RepID=W9XJG2_9EURO|nr:uncharacterized protein A1O3_06941 [Capronia epimyces CBS 606.96]EXJ80657.1 hypothetical protein A1O3_06941 [Capronia epimyces CBS 606.96]